MPVVEALTRRHVEPDLEAHGAGRDAGRGPGGHRPAVVDHDVEVGIGIESDDAVGGRLHPESAIRRILGVIVLVIGIRYVQLGL